MEESLDNLTVQNSSSDSDGTSDLFSVPQLPLWSLWLSTVLLSITFIIGLPLNGSTVTIFWKRKQLRHLVNFVLLLDCVSHIVLCLVCIPLQLLTEWSSSGMSSVLSALQQVVGDFSNIYSTFLTVSIAILRYRRLCWKKKDKFSKHNAVKWSILSGGVALALTLAQSYSSFLSNDRNVTLTIYLIKISFIILSMPAVMFCYIRVSQRIWENAARQSSIETVLDPVKIKKSRSIHRRATIHSCVQIVLIIVTIIPHLYQQIVDTVYLASPFMSQLNSTIVASNGSQELGLSTFQGEIMMDDSAATEDWSQQDAMIQEDSSTSSDTLWSGSSDNHLGRLIGITINYALLILGTPAAYIASCHRFREQFTSILFSNNVSNSPPNSGCHPNSPRNNQRRNQISSFSGVRGTRGVQGSQGQGSPRPLYSRTNGRPHSTTTTNTTITSGLLARNSISVSANNTSTTVVAMSRGTGSTKSRSSMKRNTSARRKGSRGLGTDFIIVDSESQDLSNSTNPKDTPTPSPTMTEAASCNVVSEGRRGSIFCTNLQTTFVTTTVETIARKNSLQSIFQNYGYDFSDLGELV